MSLVSLCVILIEVIEDEPPSIDLSYLAPKFSKISSDDPKSKLVLAKGNKAKMRGKRSARSLTVETYTHKGTPDATNCSGKASKAPHSEKRSGDSGDQSSGEPSKLNFFSGNPCVEVIKGVIHFFKENEPTQVPDRKNAVLSEMLCLMAVPATVSCRDLLQFVAPFQSDIENVKIIRDGTANQYMVLIKFKKAGAANLFYKANNGMTFNSIEDDVCNIAYVSRVETMRDVDGAGLPLVGHTELPTCPVCLERMDESVEGILTILCNHSFHSVCLSKWSDSSCPVCRYVQTPEMVASNQCSECQSSESLWICIICGHIGCGRYIQAHAYRHFSETSHCYAIQPGNNRVWDYVGDNFVHRLLQNKPDGKLVAVTGAETAPCDDADEKMESMQMEFTYLLNTQLETQRKYFQESMESVKGEMHSNIESLTYSVDSMTKEGKDLEQRLTITEKEKTVLEKKLNSMSVKFAKSIADLGEERELSKSLSKSHNEWAERSSNIEKEFDTNIAQYEAEVKELQEQVRDLMFHIDAQDKIKESPLKDEIQEGVVNANQSNLKPSTSSGGRKKKREFLAALQKFLLFF